MDKKNPAPAAAPVKLSNGIKSGNLAAVVHVKGPARVNKSKSHMTSFVLLFLSFLLLALHAAANNGMGVTAARGGELQQGEITDDAPNSTFIAKAFGSLNDKVSKNYFRTRTIESIVSINSSPKNIVHTNINKTSGKTESDSSDALASEDKGLANEKENTKGGIRDLVSYNSVTSRCRSLCFPPGIPVCCF